MRGWSVADWAGSMSVTSESGRLRPGGYLIHCDDTPAGSHTHNTKHKKKKDVTTKVSWFAPWRGATSG